MAQNQEGSTISVFVRNVDAGDWARFDAVARAQNRSRSAQLRELISREVEAFEASSLEDAA